MYASLLSSISRKYSGIISGTILNFTKGGVGAKKLRLGLIGAKSVSDIEKVMKTNK